MRRSVIPATCREEREEGAAAEPDNADRNVESRIFENSACGRGESRRPGEAGAKTSSRARRAGDPSGCVRQLYRALMGLVAPWTSLCNAAKRSTTLASASWSDVRSV